MAITTIDDLISAKKSEINRRTHLFNDYSADMDALRDQPNPDVARVDEIRTKRATLKAEIDAHTNDLLELERAKAEDVEHERLYRQVSPTPTGVGGREFTARVGEFGGLIDSRVGAEQWTREDGSPAAVARGQKFADHPAARAESAARSTADSHVIGTHGDIGQLVRSLSTSGASAVIPTSWAGDIIDLARSKSATIQAGATVVPMDSKTVQIGRVTGDPTVAFRDEGGEITPSDPTFDNVTLTAKTMSTLVVGSMEWLQDSINGPQLIEDAIASAMASQLDLVALYGGIEAGAGSINLASPPNPDGLLASLIAQYSANVLGATAGVTATNGTSQTSTSMYNELIDLIYKVKNGNEEPSGLVWSPRAEQLYAKAYDTTGQPLQLPSAVAAVPRFTTTKIPTYTQGTLTTATDVFAGDWSQLLIGQRLDFTIQVLTERYAEFGKVGIVAHWRGDVALARPRAFAVYKALKGA